MGKQTVTRVCRQCGKEKPQTSEYYQVTRGYMYSVCRDCKNARKRELRALAKPTRKRTPRPYRQPEVRVVENANGDRRALYVWEWDNIPDGWRLLEGGSELLMKQWETD